MDNIKKFLTYLIVGGTAAIVDWSIFALMVYTLNINYLIAGVTGFIIATFVNFLMGRKLVFKEGAPCSTRAEILQIYIVSLIGLGIHSLILFVSVEYLHIFKMGSKFIATALTLIWNFSIRIFVVYKKR